MIHIVDPQTHEILDYITLDSVIEDNHKLNLETYLQTYDAIVFGGGRYDKHLEKRNLVIIPDEDGTLQEFVLFEVDKYRDTEGRKTHFYAHASYLELKKANIIYPDRYESLTASQLGGIALNNTGWQIGIVEASGTRTMTIENHTSPYEFIKRIAREFEVELSFRVETDGQRITGRYVDLLERIGEWRGRQVEFGRDLDGIRRIEKQDIVTALLGLGPEQEDGTRLEVLVEDEEALQRWGRVDEHGNLHHLIEPYEIQSDREEMTEEEARRYTRTALDKRINTQVTYETTILDLEEVPGLENKKIRFGDTIRIKDTYFNPPLYLEARVFEIERSIKNKAKKNIKLGDYIEYTEEEVNAIWNQLRNEIRRRLDRMAIVSITSTAGNVFKNAQGETELTARTFVNGAERDEDGTLYDYQWMRFDKDGNHDTNFYAEGKTITVTANDIDEKATYRVLVSYELEVINTAEITISNVFDGEDGEQGPQGPKGEDGKTFYTWIKYADTPTSGMSDSPEGKEYIGIAYNKETPTPSTNYADYVWSKFKGEQGVPGPPGEDGQPTYTWVKYADDENGNGMSDSPEGKLYIGLAFNKTTPEESNNPADYTWSLMPQNIEIGGRNLIRNGDFSKGLEHWQSNGSISLVNVDGKKAIKLTGTTNGFYQYPTNLEENTYFTISLKAKSVGETSSLRFGFLNQGAGLSRIINVDSTWRKYTFTTTQFIDFNRNTFLHFYANNETAEGVYITEIKLEKGNKATDWTPAPEDVQEQIDEAKQEAEEAKTTADGKNTIIFSATEPSTEGRKIGDTWFDTSRDNLMHRFNGTQWVEAKWGEQSIVANSITANHIKSLVGLNVNDQFIVDSNGNVKFAGSLEGASGSFSGTILGSDIIGGSITQEDSLRKTSINTLGLEVHSKIDNSGIAVLGSFEYPGTNETTGSSIVFYHNQGSTRHWGASISENQDSLMLDNVGFIDIGQEQSSDNPLLRSFGGITLLNASGASNNLSFPSGHMISNRQGNFSLYPNRASGNFEIRSHNNRSSYRNDFWIRSDDGTMYSPPTYSNTSSNQPNLRIAADSSGDYRFYRTTSSAKYKADIKPSDIDYYKILDLDVFSWVDKKAYEDNGESSNGLQRHHGLIAEDLERVGLDQFVDYINGEIENYDQRVFALLIPIVRDLKERIDEIESKCKCGR